MESIRQALVNVAPEVVEDARLDFVNNLTTESLDPEDEHKLFTYTTLGLPCKLFHLEWGTFLAVDGEYRRINCSFGQSDFAGFTGVLTLSVTDAQTSHRTAESMLSVGSRLTLVVSDMSFYNGRKYVGYLELSTRMNHCKMMLQTYEGSIDIVCNVFIHEQYAKALSNSVPPSLAKVPIVGMTSVNWKTKSPICPCQRVH